MVALGFPHDQIVALRERLSDEVLIRLFEELDAAPPSEKPYANRFYSLCILEMGPLPGSSSQATHIDPVEEEDKRRRLEIRQLLEAEGPRSFNQLAAAIKGRRSGLAAVLNMMARDAELIVTAGPRKSKLYSLPPTLEDFGEHF